MEKSVSIKKNSKDTSSIILKELNIKPIARGSLEIDTWRSAMKTADGISKNRQKLYELYQDILIDGHLKSIIGKRIKAVTNQRLIYTDKDGVEIKELSDIIEKPFFEKLLKGIIESKFYGYSLLELNWTPYNSTGESKTYLIDRRYVKPEFGIVVKNPADSNGQNFNDLPYINFVVRAGDEDDYGLILEAAQYAIYKRGGFGDWSEFAEVFGMPFRIAKYKNPEDRLILNDALAAAGAAGYAVVPSDTEIVQDYTAVGAGSSMFNELRRACNEEMSVTILGQTETTNSSDSSGYAQSKTHADVEYSINEDDRQFTLRILNEELARVLLALNYPVAEGGRWIFPESDGIDLKDRIDIDIKIANKVPISDDYWYKKYQIPKPEDYDKLKKEMIARQEQQSPGFQQFSDNDKEQKKLITRLKDFFFKQVDTNAFYMHEADCGCSSCKNDIIYLADADITADFESFIRDIFDGKITKNQIQQGLYNKTAEKLMGALINFDMNFEYNTPDNTMLAHLKSNLFAFSGAKNLEEANKIRDLMYEGNKLKPFNKFKDDVLKINKDYNGTYLQSEHQTTQAQSRSASNWLKFERDADIYPYLEYTTAGDSNVRPEHEKFDGFTARIDDPIWNKITPPNGHRCRCALRQSKKITKINKSFTNEDINEAIPQKYFQSNPGKTKMIFDENEHPYFVNTKFQKLELNAVRNYGFANTNTLVRKAKIAFKPDLKDVDAYRSWYAKLANESGDIVITDKMGSKIAFTEKSYKHVLTKKSIGEKTFEYANIINNVLQNPDEIYSIYHNGTRRPGDKLTQRYIKFFSNKVMVVNTVESGEKIIIETWYTVSDLNNETYRSGVLLYKK